MDTLIIGGSQAGLVTSYALRERGVECLVLDAAPTIGHVWRSRWDSLVLFTPRRFSALSGMPLGGDPDGHPGKDEIADYLQAYADRFALPVRLDTPVAALEIDHGGFVARTAGGAIASRRVVIATGPFQTPVVPRAARGLAPGITQLHSSAYRHPAQLPQGELLVVGGGNSGFQIALELSRSGRTVNLAEGARNPVLPQQLLGRDLFWWLERTGIMHIRGESRIGGRLRQRDPIIGTPRRALRRAGVQLRPRVVEADRRRVRFADGAAVQVDAVVWCTGFRLDHSWIRIPQAVRDGVLQHRAGLTAVPDLCTVGLPWQRTRGSGLIGWVGRDAEAVAAHLADRARRPVGGRRT
jgi:putative flavoprotein involved in K+ transport